jgi:hypothetical protein
MENQESKRRGRPVMNDSKRQAVLAARAERIANGGEVRKGRPTSTTSKRQERLNQRATLIASGVVIKPGRPKKPAVEVVA